VYGWQRGSETCNFTREDAVPDMEFNLVLWHGLKGDSVPFPAPKRSAFLNLRNDKKGEDD